MSDIKEINLSSNNLVTEIKYFSSKFDENTGLPTHDSKDKQLSEAIVNGLKKV